MGDSQNTAHSGLVRIPGFNVWHQKNDFEETFRFEPPSWGSLGSRGISTPKMLKEHTQGEIGE